MPPRRIPASLNAGRSVSSGADGTYLIIQDGYVRGRRHQWGIELWRNACDTARRRIAAGGTLRGDEEVVFDFVDIEFVNNSGSPIRLPVWKRREWNTCDPMTKPELSNFFSTLTKGAGGNRWSTTNLSGQYGRGSRFSVLPHSHMFVATTQPGGGTDALLIYDTGAQTYALANFTFPNSGIDDDVADLRDDCYLDLGGNRYWWLHEADLIHPDVIAKGGVTTILFGPDFFDHYIDGDQAPSRSESARTLVDDLTKWTNGKLPVTVCSLFAATKAKSGRIHGTIIDVDGQQMRVDVRGLKTYDDWFARVPLGNQTTINLNDPDGLPTIEVDVHLLPEDWNWRGPLTPPEQRAVKRAKGKLIEHNGSWYEVMTKQDNWFPHDGKGFIVFQYDEEMLPVYEERMTRAQQLKQWAVNVPAVAERTAITIRFPKLQQIGSQAWGVQQTGSRGSLTGPNESPLPLDDLTNQFFELLATLPDLDFLRKALEEEQGTNVRQLDPAEFRRMLEQMNGRLDLVPMDIAVATKKKTPDKGEELTDEVEVGGRDGDPNPDPPDPPEPGPKRPRKLADPNSANKNTNIDTRPAEVMPGYEFLTEQEWKDKAVADPVNYLPEFFCVVERSTTTTLYFNMSHETYESQRIYYCTGPYFKENNMLAKLKRVTLAELEDAVQSAYATLGIADVFYANRWAKKANGHVDIVRFKQLVEPERMTLALAAYPAVDHAIRHKIGVLTR